MKEHHYYQVPLPTLKVIDLLIYTYRNQNNTVQATPGHDQDPDAEDNDIAMIPVMVALAQIMSEASHLLYHSTRRSMSEKSRIAMNLDQRLLEWKARLPGFLDIDAASLNDPEWAFKQKLVLRLSTYLSLFVLYELMLMRQGSTILVFSSTGHSSWHRAQRPNQQHTSSTFTSVSQRQEQAFRCNTSLFYTESTFEPGKPPSTPKEKEAKGGETLNEMKRWYNTTYALYGAMILLHLILASFPGIPEDELLLDVEKSLDIFESMKNIIVARRCAEMIREVLDVTRSYLARRTALHTHHPQSSVTATSPSFALGSGAGVEDTVNLQSNHNYGIIPENQTIHTPPPNLHAVSSPGSGPGPDENFFFSLFGQEEFQPDTRAEMLANLVDPMILGDFAFGGGV